MAIALAAALGGLLTFLLAAYVSPILACVAVAIVGLLAAPSCEMRVFAGLATFISLMGVLTPGPPYFVAAGGAAAGILVLFPLLNLMDWLTSPPKKK